MKTAAGSTRPFRGSLADPSPGARKLARRLYPAHKGFQRAVIRGWYARLGGRGRDECPYKGRVTHRTATAAGGTFTYAWRAAWLHGWERAR